MTTPSPYRTADPLGEVMNEHPVAGVQQGIRIAVGLFCVLVAIDCVWLGMWPRFGAIHRGGFLVTGIIALVFAWLAYDAFSQYAKARRRRVACHEHGVRIHDSNRYDEVRFDDITSIGGMLWQASKGSDPSGTVLWIDDVQGRRFEVPSPLARPYELGQTIRSATFGNRRANAEARLSRGESVRFGRLELSSLVLVIDGELLPRSAIAEVTLSNRWLAITVNKKRSLFATEEIPNLDVLLALLSL